MPISQILTPIQPPISSLKSLSSIHDLSAQLSWISQTKFSGQLILKNPAVQAQQWRLYCYLGRLIWAADLVHPIRRWYRQLALHCPHLTLDPVAPSENSPPPWRHAALAKLLKLGKITQPQGTAIVTGHCVEILFDIFQQLSQIQPGSTRPFSYHFQRQSERELSLAAIPVDQVWFQAMRDWQAWRRAGLTPYSPNQTPVLWQVDSLRLKLSSIAYQCLAALVDGDRTLRDLAVNSRQALLPMAQSILPYVRLGSIRLVSLPDLSPLCHSKPAKTPPPLPPPTSIHPPSGLPHAAPPRSPLPLVAYIDDHPLHGKMMAHVMTHLNYRLLHLQEPLQALMTLLEHRPLLIFLDLAMPIVNGYELCTQLRRVAAFKHTPIVILSSNDGIAARLQARSAGASDFLAKPIRLKQIQTMLLQHLPRYPHPQL